MIYGLGSMYVSLLSTLVASILHIFPYSSIVSELIWAQSHTMYFSLSSLWVALASLLLPSVNAEVSVTPTDAPAESIAISR